MNKFAAPAVLGYATAIGTANYLTSHYGLIPVGFGLTVTAGTYSAGCALLFRDAVQQAAGKRWALVAMALGIMITFLTAPSLVMASGVAFAISETCDMVVFTPLRRRGLTRAYLASVCVAAVVDTFAFLRLAGFPVTLRGFEGQLVGKALWAGVLPILVVSGYRYFRKQVAA